MAVGMHTANLIAPWLKVIFGTTFTAPTGGATWVALHIGDPGAAGTTLPSVGDNVRRQLIWTSPTTNVITMASAPANWTNGAATETISHISIWTLVTAGVVFLTMALTTPQPWVATNTFTLNSCSYSLSPMMA